MYARVVFYIDGRVSGARLVPVSWLNGSRCYWPPFPTSAIEKAIKEYRPVDTSWKSYEVSILKICETYGAAKPKDANLSGSELVLYERSKNTKNSRVCSSESETDSECEIVLSSSSSSKKRKSEIRDTEEQNLPPPSTRSQNKRVLLHLGHSSTPNGEIGNLNTSMKEDRHSQSTSEKKVFLHLGHSSTPNGEIGYLNSSMKEERHSQSTSEHNDMSPEDTAILCIVKKMYKNQVQMKKMMSDLKETVKNLVENQIKELETSATTDFKFDLPITSVDSLLELSKLMGNEDLKRGLEKQLSGGGGYTVKESVKIVMKKLMTYEVGSQYTWNGSKTKQRFNTLGFTSVIRGAVRRNTTCAHLKTATELDIDSYAAEWLRRCVDRLGNKSARSPHLQDLVLEY